MKKIFKIVLWSVLGIVVVLGGLLGVFIYKVKYGFPVSYETEAPAINFPTGKPAILLFSKTTGFRHGESIEASKPVMAGLAAKNNWFLYETEEGGVFNEAQLAKFSAVIFNNSTGEVINDDQKRALEKYVENGGTLIGIHGAGDDSHRWDWYEQNLLGFKFSHHPINPQFQETSVLLDAQADSLLTAGIPPSWLHSDEWYVFFGNPRSKGFQVELSINGQSINPSGNILFVTNKNFGMGKDHPVAWSKQTGQGKTFYTSMGHSDAAWKNEHFLKLIENAIRWAQVKP
ncbi:ThuA domain-containing protein [Emticicia sp. 21SJ11W-3]|uniref:ThuA domain-containing protein n=1 Tax=Emticicia sp. 21SJ11W-3 TaxID=2916755 RepID=UPI0020A209AD|nr:ThuA domain-containing protein [Emticicia sp. 21SJ11W-3]UTA66592.1 ThuA domain-containing protein [Emticicia sp. 21SJ11W-3]